MVKLQICKLRKTIIPGQGPTMRECEISLVAPPWGIIEEDDRRSSAPPAKVTGRWQTPPTEIYNAIGRAEA